MDRRWVLRLVVVVSALAMLAVACSSDDGEEADDGDTGGSSTTDSEATGDPVAGGTLRYGLAAEVDGLDPTSSQFAPSGGLIGRAVFDTLVATLDAEGNWAPKLAESFTPNEDFTEWTMTLRPDVTFHDDTPLDAEAVEFNWLRMYNDPLIGNAVRPYYIAEEPITVVDDLTVTFNLEGEGSANWPTALAGQLGMMASPAWLEAIDAGESDAQSPVGAGPFVFDSRTQDSTTKVVRNPDYYGGDVYLDGIDFVVITDPSQRADQLLEGAIDLLMTTDATATEALLDAEDSAEIVNVTDDVGEETYLQISSTSPPFDDIRVREALAWATPRAQYIERISGGADRPADQMFTPEEPYHNPDVKQAGDDPDRAVELVAEVCADTPDYCTNGKIDMQYEYSGPSVSGDRSARLFSEGWGEAFNVEVNVIPEDTVISNAATGNFQVDLWRSLGASEPYNDRVWLACETIGPISLNFPQYCSDERDRLFNEGGSSLDDEVRVANMQAIVADINEAFTYIFLNHSRWAHSFTDKLQDFCNGTTLEGAELPCARIGTHYFEYLWFDR